MPSILIVDSYYQAVIDSLGFGEGSSSLESYSDGIESLARYGFGTGGAYARELRNIGWDSTHLIPNAYALQRQWLLEHGFKKPLSRGWSYGLHAARLPLLRSFIHLVPHIQGTLYKQIVNLKPDVVLVQDLNMVTPRMAKAIRPHAKLLVGEIASPLPPKPYFANYDLIISALPSIVEQARVWGIDSAYLPLGFDTQWSQFASLAAAERPIDAIFVGSFSRHQPQTVPLLKEVSSVVPGLRIYGNASPDFLDAQGLLQYFHGPAWGREMFELLGKSKTVINRHGSIAGDYAVNMRMYEATGCGAALVTEAKSNLSDLFNPGDEVLTYSSPSEAAEVLSHVLNNPALLNSVASHGQEKTLSSHTYAHRASSLSQILETRLGRP